MPLPFVGLTVDQKWLPRCFPRVALDGAEGLGTRFMDNLTKRDSFLKKKNLINNIRADDGQAMLIAIPDRANTARGRPGTPPNS